MRRTIYLIGRMVDSVYEKDATGFMKALRRFTILTAATISVGLLQDILTQVIFRRPQPPDEDKKSMLDKSIGALVTMQFFGPVTRMLEMGNRSSPTTGDIVLQWMPQVQALADLIGFGWNMSINKTGLSDASFGRLGQTSLGTQSEALARRHFGAVATIQDWISSFAFPDYEQYKTIRRDVSNWKRDQGQEPTTSISQVNGKYYPIRQALVYGEYDKARELVQDFYASEFKALRDAKTSDPREFTKVVEGLRGSLESSAPINISHETSEAKPTSDVMRFLVSLPQDKRRPYFTRDYIYRSWVDALAPRQSNSNQ
jgi:hypothetical protein